jgi:pimeloyl-ACP methyl ester carboxylesterase
MRLERRHWFGLSLAAGMALSLGSVVPAVAQVKHPTGDPPPDARPGRVDIGGFRLFMTCTGTGSPPVILDAGGGDSSSIWDQVQPEVATMTQTCAYDRADNGYSDTRPSAETTTALLNATELHALLGAAHIVGPYVLVGHSYAGPVDQVYAGQYPADMAALVLVDPLSGLYFEGHTAFYEDVIDFDVSRQQVEASQLPNVPLIVLTGEGSPYSGPQSLAIHRAIAAQSPQGKQVIVPNSGHRIHRDQPGAVIAAIREVFEAARRASPDDNQQPDPMTTPRVPEPESGGLG